MWGELLESLKIFNNMAEERSRHTILLSEKHNRKFVREGLRGMQEVIREWQKEDPTISSLCISGDILQSNALKKGPVDCFLYVDTAKLSEKEKEREIKLVERDGKEGSEDFCSIFTNTRYLDRQTRFSSTYENYAKSHIVGSSSVFQPDQLNMTALPIDRGVIDAHVRLLQGQHIANLVNKVNRRPSVSRNLSSMFLFEIGGGIKKYRHYLLKRLNRMELDGQQIWNGIIDYVEKLEGGGKAVKGRKYPRTLAEAQREYGQI